LQPSEQLAALQTLLKALPMAHYARWLGFKTRPAPKDNIMMNAVFIIQGFIAIGLAVLAIAVILRYRR
jgi:hypothetical protein